MLGLDECRGRGQLPGPERRDAVVGRRALPRRRAGARERRLDRVRARTSHAATSWWSGARHDVAGHPVAGSKRSTSGRPTTPDTTTARIRGRSSGTCAGSVHRRRAGRILVQERRALELPRAHRWPRRELLTGGSAAIRCDPHTSTCEWTALGYRTGHHPHLRRRRSVSRLRCRVRRQRRARRHTPKRMTEPSPAASWNVDAPFYDFEVALRLVSQKEARQSR